MPLLFLLEASISVSFLSPMYLFTHFPFSSCCMVQCSERPNFDFVVRSSDSFVH